MLGGGGGSKFNLYVHLFSMGVGRLYISLRERSKVDKQDKPTSVASGCLSSMLQWNSDSSSTCFADNIGRRYEL